MSVSPTVKISLYERPCTSRDGAIALPSLLSSHQIGSAVLTGTGRIVAVAPTFAEILGTSVQDLLGQHVFELFPKLARQNFRRLRGEGTTIVVERNGASYRLIVHKITRGTTMPGSFIGLLSPLGEPNDFEERLLHRDRLAMLGELTAIAAHEIGGPLAVIFNNAELLLLLDELDEELLRGLRLIRDESQRVALLLRDLVELGRESPPNIKVHDIAAVVKRSASLLRFQVRKKNVRIRFEIEPDLPEIYGDAAQLQRVFTNILKNAWEASLDNHEIVIRLRTALQNRRRAVEIIVSDTGCGIEPKHLKRVFEPFYSLKPCGEGTGLGLAVVSRLVAAHNGVVRLTSSPGKGTRVRVVIPVARPKHSREQRSSGISEAIACETENDERNNWLPQKKNRSSS